MINLLQPLKIFKRVSATFQIYMNLYNENNGKQKKAKYKIIGNV